jgi:hypothetical protein
MAANERSDEHRALGQEATLGFRVHSGWAVAVAARGPVAAPIVVER